MTADPEAARPPAGRDPARLAASSAARVISERGSGLLLLGTLVGTTLLRLHRLGVPLERDEGEFAYVAQLVLDGVPPFELAYNMKMPGIYYAYALILGAGGESVEAIRFGLLLLNLAAIVLVFAMGRRVLGAAAGALAATSYAALSILPEVLGVFAHATHFVIVPALAGLLVLVRPSAAGRLVPPLLGGFLLGIAFLMKQHGAAFVAFGAVLVISNARQHGSSSIQLARGLALFGVGAVLPFLSSCAYLAAAGVFERFWFWTFEYARHYAGIPGRDQLIVNIALGPLPLVLGPPLPFWILAAVGTVAVARRAEYRGQRAFLLGLLVFSVAAVLPGLHLRPHYFILLLPAVSFLVAAGLLELARPLIARSGRPALVALGALGLALALLASAHRDYLVLAEPDEVSWRVYIDEFFPETRRVAEVVAARSEPGDRIAVLGSEPQIYFYAKRRAATGYLYTYPLMESHPHARRMQLEMAAELEERNPRFVVFLQHPHSWSRREDSDSFILEWIPGFLERYRRVGLVELRLGGASLYYWDAAARRRRPGTSSWCAIYERRKTPAP